MGPEKSGQALTGLSERKEVVRKWIEVCVPFSLTGFHTKASCVTEEAGQAATKAANAAAAATRTAVVESTALTTRAAPATRAAEAAARAATTAA